MSTIRERRYKAARYQKWLCHFCKVKMTEPNTGPTSVTLYHFDDRYTQSRGRHNGFIRTCAACHECTTFLSQKRTRDRPLEELHERAGRHGDSDNHEPLFVTDTGKHLGTERTDARCMNQNLPSWKGE